MKRWEYLYDMNKRKSDARDIIRKIVDEEKEVDPNCTFKPQLVSQQTNRKANRDTTQQYEDAVIKQQALQTKIKQHDR